MLVSGLAPIRADKLRHYEDRNFMARLLPAPELADGVYADAPELRPHDWADCVRTVTALPAVGDGLADAGDGGLQQARQPALPSRPRKAPAPEQLDLLGLGEDEGELAVVDLLGSTPLLAAHAANQGAARGDDLVPSF